MTNVQLSNKYEQSYCDLLLSVAQGPQFRHPKLCALWPIQGEASKHGVMIIGQAVSGWTVKFTQKELMVGGSINRVVAHARHESEAGIHPPVGRCPMMWVSDQWGRSDLAPDISRSRFWQTARDVSLQLNSDGATGARFWASYLCWSNLYKIAPSNANGYGGDNPDPPLKRTQFRWAVELIRQEISELQPKRILVMTESKKQSNDWFAPFEQALGLNLNWCDDQIVKATGVVGRTQWVVTIHPQYLPKGCKVSDIPKEIMNSFAHLSESS
jgi:hypothetical protein